MSTDNTPPKTPADEIDLTPDPKLSVGRHYEGTTLTLPVFGRIPLKPSEILKDLKIKDNPPLWAQFFKYGICGVLSVIVLILVVQSIEFFFPNFLDKDQLGENQFQINLTISLFCAFVPSNFFAYFSNRMFVFTPGKHTFFKEMSYFTLISAISFTGGELGKRAIVSAFPDNEYLVLLATLSFAISSALVNFVARKYLVFSNSSEPNSTDAVSPT